MHIRRGQYMRECLLTRGTFPFLVFAIVTTSLALSHKRAVTAAPTADPQPFMWELNPL